jgi:hypothetical protein
MTQYLSKGTSPMRSSSITNSRRRKPVYLENKDAKLDEERSVSHAVLDDFKELEEAGITHPDMEKIKALLTTETKAR